MPTEVQDQPKPGLVRRALIGRSPRLTLLRVVIWIVAIFAIRTYALLPIRVEGVSMLPTYKENRINFVNCLAYAFHPPQRGDVVAIRYAGRSIMLCIRIVGLPDEVVAFHNGHIEINGRAGFTNVNKRLVDDVTELLTSLGYQWHLRRDHSVSAWRLHFVPDEEPVARLFYKASRQRPRTPQSYSSWRNSS